MNFLINNVVPPVILYILLFIVPCVARPIKKGDRPKAPRTVAVASWIEVCSCCLFFFVGICVIWGLRIRVEWCASASFYCYLLVLGVTIGWGLMIEHLSMGSLRARRAFLVLSAIRMLTVIGAIFSVAVIALLYGTRSARQYYKA